jgi:hypothetical protein
LRWSMLRNQFPRQFASAARPAIVRTPTQMARAVNRGRHRTPGHDFTGGDGAGRLLLYRLHSRIRTDLADQEPMT